MSNEQPTRTVLKCGDIEYRLDGKLHREDGPAVERPDGTRCWHQHGELHREDGPAVEFPNGDKYWCLRGEYHRVGGPAIESQHCGRQYWLHSRRVTKAEAMAAADDMSNVNPRGQISDISELLQSATDAPVSLAYDDVTHTVTVISDDRRVCSALWRPHMSLDAVVSAMRRCKGVTQAEGDIAETMLAVALWAQSKDDINE